MALVCHRYIVRGRVQGVFFRDSTRAVAASLNIVGHAVNLADGTVEVLACGSEAALEKLERWLKDGPQLARVSDLGRTELAAAECQPASRFSVA